MNKFDLLVVTGASRGIGKSIAIQCSKKSERTLLIGSTIAINETLKLCINASALQCDLASFGSIERLIGPYIDPSKDMRIGLVLCAARIGAPGGLLAADFDEWDYLYRCNVLGNLAVLKTTLMHMNKKASIRTVIFAGGGAAYGYPEFSGYSLTKVSIVRAVENIALELDALGKKSTIIALAPGAVSTEMLEIVMANGGKVKTKTDISEPTDFVSRYLNFELSVEKLNGRFIHVRDELIRSGSYSEDQFKLRRVE